MATEAKLLTVQFLKWMAEQPRSYAEVRAAWSSTCPLNCAWEDAITDDLVERGADGHLALTARGHALVDAMAPRVMNFWNKLLRGFSHAEVDTLVALLTRLVLATEGGAPSKLLMSDTPIIHAKKKPS